MNRQNEIRRYVLFGLLYPSKGHPEAKKRVKLFNDIVSGKEKTTDEPKATPADESMKIIIC
ncbi:hypothetical protein HOE31_00960 [bacterium]|jgi:hypothetical protein|nr:hypothetical protein [bacterium]MBT4121505.1 hypothetical protein [bacterium]MBT4335333.1 hypothetical protein [bacterium]MBT4495902.1 hypothetical protein [bacterium]MBT4764070.1 hypothetical protein [bacterium]